MIAPRAEVAPGRAEEEEEELDGVRRRARALIVAEVPPRDDQSPAAIFRLLEERCDALSISDYSVSQPTMEQVRAATLCDVSQA